MRTRMSFMFTMLLASSVLSATEKDYLNPKLKEHEASVKIAVVLPAHVDMEKHGVKGVSGMGQESDEAARQVAFEVAKALANRGVTIDKTFTEEALKNNEDLRLAMADVQQRFDQIEPQLFKKEKDVKKGRFTLGDSVAVLNPTGKTDAFVIVRAVGAKETKSKAFMTGGLIGMAAAGEATFRTRVAIVDAKNGDILFVGDFESRGLPSEKVYEHSFKKIPFQ